MRTYKSQVSYWLDFEKWGRLVLEDRDKGAAFMDKMDEKAKASLEAGLFLPLAYLAAIFDLNRFERHCLYLAVLPELNLWFEAAFAGRRGEKEGRLLSEGLALSLYRPDQREEGLSLRDCFANDGNLRRYFLRPGPGGNRSDLAVSWKLSQRIKEFVLDNRLDNSGLAGFAYVWEPEPKSAEGDPESQGGGFYSDDAEPADPDNMGHFLEMANSVGDGVAFLLTGPAGSGKKRRIIRFAQDLRQAVLFVDVAKIVTRRGFDADVLNDLYRESVLRQGVICFDGLDALGGPEQKASAIAGAMLEGALKVANLVFATAASPMSIDVGDFSGRLLVIEQTVPDGERRRFLWRSLASGYNISPQVSLDELADKFIFTPGQIRQALAESENMAIWLGLEAVDQACLHRSCYNRIEHELEGTKAVKIPAVFLWDDLILPPASKELLRTACAQVLHKHTVYNQWGFGAKLPYGRGLSLLFSGAPGTGKTMGAQVVANELKLELYKVDLAGVVSKYIGETEKNLREIFREAKKSQVILFFDEADVLFSKRTEVKDANDKYSNMEAAFMLQKVEEYEGVCVLATNYLQNIDEAFKRRLKFVIEFPFPNAAYRLKLWRAVFPPQTPLGEDVDREFLAGRFELSGSSIKNIAVNASFIAASQNSAVTMKEIIAALRHELVKSGKTVRPEDFGEYYMLV